MRKLNRLDPPEAFRANAKKWQAQWEEQNDKGKDLTWYEHDKTPANQIILSTLVEMTNNHCSFCECYPTDTGTRQTIEHFKPKKKFPEKGYDWNNLFLCCDACQRAKQEQWEDGLLKPDHPNYATSRFFQYDFERGMIEPNEMASEADQNMAEITIRLYGLNAGGYPRERAAHWRKWKRGNIALEDLDRTPYPSIILAAKITDPS